MFSDFESSMGQLYTLEERTLVGKTFSNRFVFLLLPVSGAIIRLFLLSLALMAS